jgi:hypothetical protein
MAAAMRRYSGNPELTMVIAQLSYLINPMQEPTALWGKLRDVQRQFCAEDPHAILVPALPYSHKDPIHLSAEGATQLGIRMGQALAESRKAGRAVWQGPRALAARFTDASRRTICVDFECSGPLRLSDEAIGKMQPVKDEKWDDKVTTRSPAEDWYVTDDAHRGEPELLEAKIEKGVLKVQVAGARIAIPTIEDARGTTATLAMTETGYLRPVKANGDGNRVLLELPEPAGKNPRGSYGLFSNSRSTLMDAQGRPAAVFVDLTVGD